MRGVRQVFWMVYGVGQRSPTYEHETQYSAEQEARRLARSVPGVQFVVLEAKTGYRLPVQPIAVEVSDYIDLPF